MDENIKPYHKFTEVDVPWLKYIPEHWKIQRAKNLYEKVNRPVKEDYDTITCFRDGVVTLRKNRRTTGFTESIKEIGYQGICKGDLVIHVMDAFAGAVGVSDSEGKSTPVYSVCIPKGEYNNYYYAHVIREMAKTGYIQSLYRGIRERSSDFRFEVFGRQLLPVPSFEEQNQIVRYLNSRMSLINKFIKDKKREIILLKEQKQAEIKKAVTCGLNSKKNLKDTGINWIGQIPEHWDMRYLFQLSEEQRISNKTIKNQNLLSLSYGKIINKDINSTAGLLPASFDTYQIVNDGNIILRLTDLQNDHKSLRVGLVTQTGIITSAYTCIKVKEKLIPEYLHLVLHTYDVLKVFYGMGGGLRQSIGYKEIKKLVIILPPIIEQQEILNYTKIIEERINTAVAAIEKEITLIQDYKTSLISDVVTGKVDVRNVAVEKIEDVSEEEMEEIEETEELENS